MTGGSEVCIYTEVWTCIYLHFALLVIIGGAGLAIGQEEQTAPTYNETIAPLIHAQCTECHRPGEVAPFSLRHYDEVRKHARTMLEVIEDGSMPPWPPDRGVVAFEDERGLSSEQRALFRAWVEAGLPEGDPEKAPVVPTFPVGWRLGEPDMVVAIDPGFRLGAEGVDVYRSFVLPLSLDNARNVRAVEFRPGSTKTVHHAVVTVDGTGSARQLDALDPGQGFAGTAGTNPGGHFIGWSPGATPRPFGDGLSWRVEPGMDLVLQLHLLPSGKEEVVAPKIGLFFTDQPPRRTPTNIRLGVTEIDLPPGTRDYVRSDTFTLPVDIEALSVYPHAHFLCTSIETVATLPDGSIKHLIKISDWDFDWQGEYLFKEPVRLPAGTRLKADFRYDNSDENEDNPNSPPKLVTWGARSFDEMGEVWIKTLTGGENDLELLVRATYRDYIASQLAGYKARLNRWPDDLDSIMRLGHLMVNSGKGAEAIPPLTRALELSKVKWSILNDLGIAQARAGDIANAIESFEHSVEGNPGFPPSRKRSRDCVVPGASGARSHPSLRGLPRVTPVGCRRTHESRRHPGSSGRGRSSRRGLPHGDRTRSERRRRLQEPGHVAGSPKPYAGGAHDACQGRGIGSVSGLLAHGACQDAVPPTTDPGGGGSPGSRAQAGPGTPGGRFGIAADSSRRR